MEIVRVESEDLGELSALYQQLIPNPPSLERMKLVLEQQRNNPYHTVLVAKDDGRLVGTLLAVTCPMLFGQCRSFMVVEDVVVDAEFRRRGVGKALMCAIENQARHQNCSYIMLITDADRTGSQRFYESLGYKSAEFCAFKKHL